MAFSDHARSSVPVIETNSLLTQRATKISWSWWGIWVVLFGIFSTIVARDASYDVVHYHLHNGWAVLNGRYDQDLAPAEMHTFLNPVWQILVWLLVDNLPGRVVAFILGALQALCLPAIYAFTRRILVRANATPSFMTVMTIAVAGFMTESQFGMISSTRNDAIFAGICVAAFALILPDNRTVAKASSFALASFLVGSLMGIKLTSAIYVVMFAIPALILMNSWQSRLRLGAICAGAGLSGFIIFGGPWALYLFETFGNPIYPQLNAYFDAPLGPDIAFRDTRMLPNSFVEAVLKPIVMLYDATYSSGAYEHYFDPRLQMTYLCGPVLIGLAYFKRSYNKLEAGRMAIALGAGGFIAILVWVLMFSFSRYIAAAWLIGPSMLALAIALYHPELFEKKLTPYICIVLAILLFAVTTTLPLRRVAWTNWSDRYVSATVPESIDYSNAVVAFSGAYPSAFLAPYFPPETVMTHLAPQDWSAPALENYRPLIHEKISYSARQLYVVIVDTESHFSETLERLARIENIAVKTESCQPITTNMQTPEAIWKICEAYPQP